MIDTLPVALPLTDAVLLMLAPNDGDADKLPLNVIDGVAVVVSVSLLEPVSEAEGVQDALELQLTLPDSDEDPVMLGVQLVLPVHDAEPVDVNVHPPSVAHGDHVALRLEVPLGEPVSELVPVDVVLADGVSDGVQEAVGVNDAELLPDPEPVAVCDGGLQVSLALGESLGDAPTESEALGDADILCASAADAVIARNDAINKPADKRTILRPKSA